MTYFKKVLLVSLVSFLIGPVSAFAAVQSLNGLTGQNQTFTNDTNVTINSSGTVHSLGWSGILPVARGGTGVNIANLPAHSVLFKNAGVVSGDANFVWDKNIKSLKLGNGNNMFAILDTTGFTSNIDQTFTFPDKTGTFALIDSIGLGRVYVDSLASDSGIIIGNSGLDFYNGNNGLFRFNANNSQFYTTLDTSLVSASDKVFVFPNNSGTFSLLESNQVFSGENTFSNPVNKFISSTNSTVHIGADGIPGCMVMGDSDGSGVTYITVNDGVLSTSVTPASNCN